MPPQSEGRFGVGVDWSYIHSHARMIGPLPRGVFSLVALFSRVNLLFRATLRSRVSDARPGGMRI